MQKFESETVEFKEKLNETLPKEIVAFLNTDGGSIYIGIKDDGSPIGVSKVDENLKKISDIITDSIEPVPTGLVEPKIEFIEDKTVIVIDVKKGLKSLYCIKKHGFSQAGCYLRIGSSCKSMSTEEIQRRYMQGLSNRDLIISSVGMAGNFSFNTLKNYYTSAGYHLNDNSFEQSLKLRTVDGHYNKMAELLSDSNMIPIIVVKFDGKDKTCISSRNDYGGGCLLFTYEKIRNRFVSENICKTDTSVRPRVDKYLFDMNAVNEALINAIIHNDWTVSQPLFCIFSNRIEILSHGGLPSGQSEEQFFSGVSCPRNDMLMTIFNQMKISEHTGHGIPVIVSKYGKEAFKITDNYINVTIPFNEEVMAVGGNLGGNSGGNLGGNSELENFVISKVLENNKISAKTISEQLGVGQRSVERAFATLKEKGIIEREGGTRGIWIVKK